MNICVIPARGGSKRIPRKNIKKFHGKPIIAYSIEAALASGCFDKVIVSTDDKEIAEIATKFGAEVPFIRPPELSDDLTGSDEVIRHAVNWYTRHGIKVDYVCCVYATAPFLSSETIELGFNMLVKSGKNFAFSVAEYDFPIQRALRLSNNGVEVFQYESINLRSQDLELAYHDAGQFYWGTASAYLENKEFYSDQTVPIKLPRYLTQDIDTSEDWEQAELLYNVLKMKKKNGFL